MRSTYQLAKILNRAQQNVARDCDLLAGHSRSIHASEEARQRQQLLMGTETYRLSETDEGLQNDAIVLNKLLTELNH